MTEPRYDDLKALFINCTLKRSPEISNTQGLVDLSTHIMGKHGVQVEVLRAIDHDIATGIWPDMTQHGWATDEDQPRPRRCSVLAPSGPDSPRGSRIN
jgi:hypothetical protein